MCYKRTINIQIKNYHLNRHNGEGIKTIFQFTNPGFNFLSQTNFDLRENNLNKFLVGTYLKLK